jgi:hypothetical protein
VGGGSRQAPWAGGADHLSRVAAPRCSSLHGGGREGGECFCGSVFLSGMDFFGGQRGSWLWKASAAAAVAVLVLRSR